MLRFHVNRFFGQPMGGEVQTLITADGAGGFAYCLLHSFQRAPAASAAGHHRNLQDVLQQFQIHADAPAAGFVPQVDAQDQRNAGIPNPFQFQHLLQQVQAPFQTAGVADHQDHVRQAGAEELAGHLFFF